MIDTIKEHALRISSSTSVDGEEMPSGPSKGVISTCQTFVLWGGLHGGRE